MTISEQLGEFVAELDRKDPLPDAVLDHATLCLLDSIGCGLYGSTLPWTTILKDTLLALDSTGACQVIGMSERLGAPHAALLNGAAIHAFELDDLHRNSIVHPGSVVIPAALAAASDRVVSGRQFLAAMVAGYEVAARVGMSLGSAHLVRGFHPTGTHGVFGAAAAASYLLNLDAPAVANALGIAGTQASGLMSAQYASMVKRFHAGRAAQSGVYAAHLSLAGYTGIERIFEEGYGSYGSTLSPHSSPSLIARDLGKQWETLKVGFKPYSTNGSCHPTIDILLEMIGREGVEASDVARVHVWTSTATKEHVGWAYRPDSVTSAQMNLSYIVAAVMSDGDAFVEQFSQQRIHDPDLIAFAHRVVVTADPQIDNEGDEGRHHTRVEVELVDGRVLRGERRWARGSAREPLAWGDVEAKFLKLCGTAVSDDRAREIVAAIRTLRDADDLAPLLGLVCA